jgi:hypothetical protein
MLLITSFQRTISATIGLKIDCGRVTIGTSQIKERYKMTFFFISHESYLLNGSILL